MVNKTTDNNGYVGLQVSIKKDGTNYFVFVFLGDDNCTVSMSVHKVTIVKKSTKIVANAEVFKAKTKSKKYTVTLKKGTYKIYTSYGKNKVLDIIRVK